MCTGALQLAGEFPHLRFQVGTGLALYHLQVERAAVLVPTLGTGEDQGVGVLGHLQLTHPVG